MIEFFKSLIMPQREKLPSIAVRQNVTYWEKATFGFVIVMYMIFPLTIGSMRYSNITETKYNFFRLFTISYVVLIMIMSLAYILEKKIYQARKNEGFEKVDLPQIICIIYFISALISGLLTPYEDCNIWIGNGRFEGLMAIMCYCLIFICLSFWGEYSEYYFYALSISVTVFSITGILQTAGIQFFKFTSPGYGYSTTHFVATLGNVDMVSGFTALALAALAGFFVVYGGKTNAIFCLVPYTLLAYLHHYIDVDSGKVGLVSALIIGIPILGVKKKQLARIFLVLASTLLAIFFTKFIIVSGAKEVYSVKIAFTKSTAIYLFGTLICVLIALFFEKQKEEFKASPKKLRLVYLVLIVVFAVVAFIFLYNYSGNIKLLQDISLVTHGEFPDSIGSHRGYIWKKALSTIPEMPFFGSGPDTFIFRFMQYNDGASVTDFAHNDFIQIAVNQGLVGLGLYLTLLLIVAVRAIKLVDKNPRCAILGIACVSYLAHSFFSFSIAIIAPYFWVTFGLLNKCVRQTIKNPIVSASNSKKKKS